MADNTVLNTGSGGDTISTDDIAGVKVQRVKVQYGTDGSATDVSDSNPLPIDDAGGSITVDGTVGISTVVTEDAASAGAESLYLMGAVRRDTAASSSGTDGDYSTVNTDANGRIWVNASGAAVPVTDNGGSITVDGTVAVSGTVTVDGSGVTQPVSHAALTELAAAINASSQVDVNIAASGATVPVSGTVTANLSATDNAVLDTIASPVATIGTTPLQRIAIFDNADTQITSFGGGTQYTEGATDASITGTAMLWEDASDTLATVSAASPLPVEIVAGAGSGGTAAADDADFTAGTTSGTPVMGSYQSSPTAVTDGDMGIIGITADREVKVSVTSGGVPGFAEDAAHTTGDEGVQILAVRRDSAAVGSGTDGDYSTLNVDANGRLYVQVHDGGNSITIDGSVGLSAGTNNIGDVDVLSIAAGDNNIGNVDIVTMPNVTLAAGTNTNEVVGDVAHDAAAAGNPVAIAARATNSVEGLTQVAAADATYVTADLNGCLVTRPYTTLEEIISERVADTGGTSTAFTNFAAGGAGVHNYVTSITIWNSSSTDGFVDIRDGAAGAVLATVPAPQTGGSHLTFPVPLKGAANTALAYDVSGAITTVYITVVGFQAQG